MNSVELGIEAIILAPPSDEDLRCVRRRRGADRLRQLKRRGIALVIQGMNASQQRTCRLMKATTEDQHVDQLSEAIDWVDRTLADREHR